MEKVNKAHFKIHLNVIQSIRKKGNNCDRVENIVGKGEILVTSIFYFFSQCFQKASFLGFLKAGKCTEMGI